MTFQEEEALRLFQQHRDTDRAVLAAMIDEALAPPDYTAIMNVVRVEMERAE